MLKLMIMNYRIFVWWLLFNIQRTLANLPLECNLETSDFSEIVCTPCFIDNTLLIRQYLEGPKQLAITSPRKFGKSTNLNMIKRFAEVDDSNATGNSSTFRLFFENKLEISKYTDVITSHFNKYPVMHIDYKPLEEITCYENTIQQFRLVLQNTFEQHMYLVESSTLWGGEYSKKAFIQYVHPEQHLALTTADIRSGLKMLLTLLHKHHGKKVIVLVDNYDAYVENLMLQTNLDSDTIMTFIRSINKELLVSNDRVDRFLLSGVLQLDETVTGVKDVTNWYFLGDSPVSKFYGLTSDQADVLLDRFVVEKTRLAEKRRFITDYYNGYSVINQGDRVFSLWSVLNYFYRNREVNYYKRKKGYLTGLMSILRVRQVADAVQSMLAGEVMPQDVSRSFSVDDITALSDLARTGDATNTGVVQLVCRYLYQLGYFSPSSSQLSQNSQDINLTVPNKETFYELKALKADYSTIKSL